MNITNRVIAGEYIGRFIKIKKGKIFFLKLFSESIEKDKNDIKNIKVVNKENCNDFNKIYNSSWLKSQIYGEKAAIADIVANSNAVNYIISIEYVSGEKSLIEIDGKNYKKLLIIMYN